MGINDWNWSTDAAVFGELGTWSSTGSLHSGGCFFAMGDGSVRFVVQSTSFTVLIAMSTIAGNEVADTDW